MSESLPELQSPRTRRHQESIDVAARTAARAGFSEEMFRDSVLGVRDDVDGYSRALHVVEKRKVHLCTTPGPGKSREQKALPNPDSVDPWAVDVLTLAATSRVVGWCPSCLGSGATKCPSCRGASKLRCARCEGSGVDARGGECPGCGGMKKTPCGDCKGGQVECAGCKGTGEVTAWLEVERSTRPVVTVHPMGAAARAHPHVSDPADFECDPSRWAATRVEDTGVRPPGDAPRELAAAQLKPNERAVSTRVQRFQTVRCLVTYGTALATGMVPVSGAPPEVDATADWRPIELRRNVALVFGAVSLGLGLVFASSWSSRHAWYAQSGHGPVVIALAVVLALALTLTASGILLHGQARTAMRVWVPAGALMLLTGALALVTTRSRPRPAHAQASFDAGDLARATLEADALRALDLDRAAGEAILDRVHLRALTRAATPEAMAASARAPWYQNSAREEARRTVVTALERAVTGADDARITALADLAREFAPPLRERLLREGALRRAGACAASGDGRCVRDETTRALEHGAEPAQTDPLLRQGRTRCAESLRALVAQADAARVAAERVARLRPAIARSEGCTALTQEPTDPTVESLRQRMQAAETTVVAETRPEGQDEEAPSSPRRRRHRGH
jgi:hypothetical protein